jgi:S-adenosylmethionine:tRNA-ribosyltransferase-isomerase (queuine synthetase)
MRSAPMMAQASPGIVGGATETIAVTDEATTVNTQTSAVMVNNGSRDKKDKNEVDLSTKLHSDLLQAYNCWKSRQANCSGVKDGKVRVEVWLERSLAKNEMEQLFSAGLKPEQDKSIVFATNAKSVRGTIDLDKLPKLAKLAGVRLVSLAK